MGLTILFFILFIIFLIAYLDEKKWRESFEQKWRDEWVALNDLRKEHRIVTWHTHNFRAWHDKIHSQRYPTYEQGVEQFWSTKLGREIKTFIAMRVKNCENTCNRPLR